MKNLKKKNDLDTPGLWNAVVYGVGPGDIQVNQHYPSKKTKPFTVGWTGDGRKVSPSVCRKLKFKAWASTPKRERGIHLYR